MNWLHAVPTPVPSEDRDRLVRDLETYRRELPRLLQEGFAGRYAIIREGQVVGVWESQDAALEAVCSRFGLEPVAIYRINEHDVQRFARLDPSDRPEAPCRP